MLKLRFYGLQHLSNPIKEQFQKIVFEKIEKYFLNPHYEIIQESNDMFKVTFEYIHYQSTSSVIILEVIKL